MDSIRFVWIASPDGRLELTASLAALNDLGFLGRVCGLGESLQFDAELRVLQADAFGGPDEFQTEYLADSRPTLVLTRSDEQALAVLAVLSEHDDLAPFTHGAELLALRLSRLKLRGRRALRAAPLLPIDTLTGLPKRERFEAELAPLLAALPAEPLMALLYLDIDHFKRINESQGRLGGDLVLVQLSMLLGAELAPSDKLAHLGGDKFACLLSRYDRATLLTDARLLLERIAQHQFLVDAQAADGAAPTYLSLTASAGLAFVRQGATLAELWRQLDVALFEAKTKGRNRLSVYAEPSGIRPLGSSPEAQAQVQHFLNVTQVVSERVEQLLKPTDPTSGEAVARDSYQDPLTQLNNRRYFDLRLEREFGSARKHGRPLSIAWMDVSHLHALNQRFGWAAGDRVLKAVAEQAQASIRLVDWLARCGGQEFCLVMPDTDLLEGQRVAQRILSKLEACSLTAPDGRALTLKLSLGVAQMNDQMQQAEQLIQEAAEALRQAKSKPTAV